MAGILDISRNHDRSSNQATSDSSAGHNSPLQATFRGLRSTIKIIQLITMLPGWNQADVNGSV